MSYDVKSHLGGGCKWESANYAETDLLAVVKRQAGEACSLNYNYLKKDIKLLLDRDQL